MVLFMNAKGDVTLRKRFESKIRRTRGCWHWTASPGTAGYGQIGVGGRAGRPVGAHRVAWELYRGAIPDGLFVLHSCDNKLCVKPAHLFLGTQLDNIHDMMSKGRDVRNAPKGERAGLAKLTNQDVRRIRKLYATGRTQYELAEQFDVGQSTISSITRRQTWTHI